MLSSGRQSYQPQAEFPAELRGLKILAFCDYFSPRSSGGIERVAMHVLERLDRWGASVEIVTALPAGMPPDAGLAGVRVHAARMLDLSGALHAQAGLAPGIIGLTWRAFKRFRPDVLFVNGIHFQASLAGLLLQLRTRTPMLTASHVADVGHLRQPTRALTQAYESSLGRLLLARSARVIAISDSVRDHLSKLGVPASRIEMVPNGVDLRRFRPARRRSGVPPLVLFVGRHIANKGPDTLIEALIRLHREHVPFEARFLSDGPLRDTLRSRAQAAGLDGRVTFTGHVPDVAVEMRRADIVVRPSLTEGMPLSLMEAMASGVCLVASDIPGNRDLVRDGVNGLLAPPSDPKALAAVLRRALEDGALRRRLAAAGRDTVQAYSWDACAAATARVLLGAREAALA